MHTDVAARATRGAGLSVGDSLRELAGHPVGAVAVAPTSGKGRDAAGHQFAADRPASLVPDQRERAVETGADLSLIERLTFSGRSAPPLDLLPLLRSPAGDPAPPALPSRQRVTGGPLGIDDVGDLAPRPPIFTFPREEERYPALPVELRSAPVDLTSRKNLHLLTLVREDAGDARSVGLPAVRPPLFQEAARTRDVSPDLAPPSLPAASRLLFPAAEGQSPRPDPGLPGPRPDGRRRAPLPAHSALAPQRPESTTASPGRQSEPLPSASKLPASLDHTLLETDHASVTHRPLPTADGGVSEPVASPGAVDGFPAAPPRPTVVPIQDPSQRDPLPARPSHETIVVHSPPNPLLLRDNSAQPPGPAASHATPSGSLLGLAAPSLLVRLDGSRARITDKGVEIVSGQIVSGKPERLVLYSNGVPRDVVVEEKSFQASVVLAPGLNQLRAVATDWRGVQVEDAITLEYVPSPIQSRVVISSPKDGVRLGPDDLPVVVVEGQVEDHRLSTVWIVANDARIPVRSYNGRFRHAVPAFEPVLRLRVETERDNRPPDHSQTVTVYSAASSHATGVLVIDWPPATVGIRAEVTATWRATPARLDPPAQPIPLHIPGATPDRLPPDIFCIRNIKPGVHTFLLSYRAPAVPTDVHATLYLPETGSVNVRSLGPLRLKPSGEVILARVLVPQGILWEQDDWFTGHSESADTVTKFRFPEGISWRERKRDLD